MGEVTLNINTNFQQVFERLDRLEKSMTGLTSATNDYNQKSSSGFQKTAQSASQVNKEIKEQEKIIKDMNRELEKLAKTQNKHTAEQAKTYKRLQGDLKVANQELKGMQAQQAQVNNQTSIGDKLFKKLGVAIIAAFSVGAVVSFFKSSIEGLKAQEIAEAQLLNSLAGRRNLQAKLIEQAKDLSKTTLFKDEDIIRSQSILSVFVKQESQLKGLTPLVADFAQKFGMSLPDAAKQVGKAVTGSAVAMKKLGFDITGTAGSTERFNSVFAELTDKVGGSAVAAANTNLGSVENLSKAWGEFGETLVSLVGPALSGLAKGLTEVTQSADTFFSDKTLSAWQKFVFLFQAASGNIAGATDTATDAIVSNAEEQRNALGPARDGYEDFLGFLEEEKQEAEDIAAETAKNAKERQKTRDMFYQQEIANIKQLQGWINELNKNFGEIGETLDTDKGIFDIPDPEVTINPWIESFSNVSDAAKKAYDSTTEAQKLALQEQLSQLEAYKKYLKPEEYTALYDEIQKKLEGLMTWAEKHPLADALGVTSQEQLDQIKDYVGQLFDFATQIVDQQVEASERIVEDQNQRIEEQEDVVNREFELKKEGLANNYAVEQENLTKMQKARDQAIKDREKAIKIQKAMSTVESGVALVSAAANIIKGFSGIPIVGVALGLAAVGAMIAGFIVSQSKVKDAVEFGEGGLLTGKRHSQGGIRIPGTNIEVEGDEYVTNRRSTAKYLPLLEAINKDDRDGMRLFFDRKFINRMPQQKFYDIDKSKKLGEIARNTRRNGKDIQYGPGYIIERDGGYTKKINLN